MTQPISSHEKARAIVNAALERKAEEPVALDVRELTSFTEAFVVVVGRSDRQIRSIAEEVTRMLKQSGDAPLGVEGLETAGILETIRNTQNPNALTIKT